MSVILEFSIPATGFQLGNVLSGPPDMQIELERIVPTGNMVMPFVWATGENHEEFAKTVQSHSSVKQFLELDSIGDSRLYRIEWEEPPVDLLEGISRADAVVLEVRGGVEWSFRLRFPDHEKLAAFHNYILEHTIPVHIDRTYTLSETTEHGHRFDLTPEQREALVLALRNGYFETPSKVSLDDLADKLGITRQALSNRIRRANEKVLTDVLLSPRTGSE